MPPHDVVDPTVAEADQRAERAKASLLSRVDLLKHRFTDATHRLDLPAHIVKHPLPAVGIAFALGVVAGLRRVRPVQTVRSEDVTERSFRGMVLAGLATVSLRVVRELAMAQLGQIARQWWTNREHGSSGEAGGSRLPDVEPFLEH